jgi:hydroxymethylpyrimidine/phosphomethylpyrimidine kinase
MSLPAHRGRVLVIAGSDSGGGAGIQADIKTITALGGYAATAITAVTVQNTLGVSAIHPIPRDIVQAQARAVLEDIGADAIKTGMLGDVLMVEAVAA